MDEIAFACLLQRCDSVRVKAQISVKVLRHLAHQPHKRRLAYQQVRRLLVLPAKRQHASARGRSRHQRRHSPDLSQRLRPRPKAVWLFDAANLDSSLPSDSALARLRSGRHLRWCAAASGPARGLLGPVAVSFSALPVLLHCGGSPCHVLCVATHCGPVLLSTHCGSVTVTGFGDAIRDGD